MKHVSHTYIYYIYINQLLYRIEYNLFLQNILLVSDISFTISKISTSEIHIIIRQEFKLAKSSAVATRNINIVYGQDNINE